MEIASKRARRSSPEQRRFWQKHLEAQERSGLSIINYCREHGLSRGAFGYWRRELPPAQPEASSVTIVPVPLSAYEPPPGPAEQRIPLRLIVADRFHIEIGGDFASSVLEKLIVTLERTA